MHVFAAVFDPSELGGALREVSSIPPRTILRNYIRNVYWEGPDQKVGRSHPHTVTSSLSRRLCC